MELVAKQGAQGALFSAFYGPICRDLGQSPDGTEEHMEQLLQSLSSSAAFDLQGPRCRMRRWFQWMVAARWHDQAWHSRLLVMSSLGMQMGIWNSIGDHPFFGGPRQKGPEEESHK
eukprot:10927968-Lingulodinium_polyedra.AAC.1